MNLFDLHWTDYLPRSDAGTPVTEEHNLAQGKGNFNEAELGPEAANLDQLRDTEAEAADLTMEEVVTLEPGVG